MRRFQKGHACKAREDGRPVNETLYSRTPHGVQLSYTEFYIQTSKGNELRVASTVLCCQILDGLGKNVIGTTSPKASFRTLNSSNLQDELYLHHKNLKRLPAVPFTSQI